MTREHRTTAMTRYYSGVSPSASYFKPHDFRRRRATLRALGLRPLREALLTGASSPPLNSDGFVAVLDRPVRAAAQRNGILHGHHKASWRVK